MTCISSDLIFDLTIYVVQVCLSFIPTWKSTQSLLEIGWKGGKTIKCLGEEQTHWAIEWIIWETYILFCKTHKTSG
jgi:hypothetical protein